MEGQLGDLGGDGRIILKWVLIRSEVVDCIWMAEDKVQ
jgi:hypothetical protein